MTDLEILLAIDALGAGDMRAFATRTSDPSVGLSINAEIKDGGVLRGVCGYGADFSEALSDLWRQLTVMEKITEYVVVNAGRETRRAVRWNGAGFRPQYEPERTASA
jgi:hypothetical protein